MESHIYQVDVKWMADRIGEASSPELLNKIDVATPPQFPKGLEGVWSPEHFFTAAVNGCFMTTFLAIAENSKLSFTSFHCTADGKLEKVDGKYLMTEVALKPILVIESESDREKAERILQKSETACLISNSIKSKVSLITDVRVK
ncbi:MAG TPA: OsmC family protein [Saprospiraceae bacterium]|nr:OsmC family protein [Saprospiraceae bacterium]MBK7697715.1 OsmC family protein [Saprospiraceae bacterium]MBK8826297.1 OsmC family protein [Saprospiraceae bacterium]MBK9580622.1 OsmC family protein [Saprospiraceae bacterium]MBP6540484.1 OsmC family protein [Saprospiraceae bacterium]